MPCGLRSSFLSHLSSLPTVPASPQHEFLRGCKNLLCAWRRILSTLKLMTGICTVYDCCIDTIYLLSFEDMSRSGGPKYMSADLRAGFGFDNAENEVSSSATKYKVAA